MRIAGYFDDEYPLIRIPLLITVLNEVKDIFSLDL